MTCVISYDRDDRCNLYNMVWFGKQKYGVVRYL